MTNLRILVKRDGERVVQEYVIYGEGMGQAGTRWQDLPIVHEPEPEKSFGQVAFDAYCRTSKEWETTAQAVLDEARRRGLFREAS